MSIAEDYNAELVRRLTAEAELKAARSTIVRLAEDAAADIQDWGAYASAYFQEKWDLQGDVDRYKRAAAKYRALLDGDAA